MNGDRNLLFGVLALQMDFITRDDLVAALHAWMLDKQRALGEILRNQGKLTPARASLLDQLVAEHLQAHQGDAQQSLAAVPASSSLKSALRSLREPVLEPALVSLGAARRDADPHATASTAGTADWGKLRYHILRPHAKGGLGEVFVALDEELNREVALKEIQQEHADVAPSRQRFVLEAEITGGLEHPGIVPVYGLGSYPDGRPYYAMRFIRGDNLKEAIARFHRQPSADSTDFADESVESAKSVDRFSSVTFRGLLRRFIDMCNAVAYAHSRGVLHRDLKPGNVMLGKFGETLVVDWGLAKAVGARSVSEGTRGTDEQLLRPTSGSGLEPTQMGSALGTPAYMSPEQAAGRLDQLGPATDIYSLGATLFTILTNRPPVEGTDVGEILRRVQAGDIAWQPPPPAAGEGRGGGARVPKPLLAICKKAMALRPQDRYASPLDIARDVESWLADEPVSSHQESMWQRLRRWSRKHRTYVVSGVVMLALTCVLLVGVVLVISVTNSRLRASYEREKKAMQLAQETIDGMISPEATKYLEQQRELHPKQKELLLTALYYYSKLAEETEPTEEGLMEQGRAFMGMGLLLNRLGHTKSALTAFENALNVSGQLVKHFPGKPRYRQAMGEAHRGLARQLNSLGDHLSASHHLSEALGIHQKLSEDFPQESVYRKGLAGTYIDLAKLSSTLNDKPGARTAYEHALRLTRRLAEDNPSTAEYRADLALACLNLGAVLGDLNDHAGALTFFRQSVELYDRLVSDSPDDLSHYDALAVVNSNLAMELEKDHDYTSAFAHHLKAINLQYKVVSAFPGVPESRHRLGNFFFNLGRMYRDKRELGEARAACNTARQMAQQLALFFPDEPAYALRFAEGSLELADIAARSGKSLDALDECNLAIDTLSSARSRWPKLERARTLLTSCLVRRGIMLELIGRYADALKDIDKAIELDDGDRREELMNRRLALSFAAACPDDPAWPLLWGWPRF